MSTQQETHAIIIGGGIAGLLAARVLSEHFHCVTILEADDVLNEDAKRKGVPQQHHIHTLLAKGREILESLYPGLDDELAQRDVPLLTWGKDTRVLTTGGYVQSRNTGIQGRAHSRNTLESCVRKRTHALPNVRLLSETRVVDLLHESGRIVGVQISAHRDKHFLEELHGDLVVDASGRQSQTPDMLKRLGYPTPEESTSRLCHALVSSTRDSIARGACRIDSAGCYSGLLSRCCCGSSRSEPGRDHAGRGERRLPTNQ